MYLPAEEKSGLERRPPAAERCAFSMKILNPVEGSIIPQQEVGPYWCWVDIPKIS
ncbi:hypothetical protein [Massilia terrae]|uniref:Uncharacterized protein n=1 Tax=Massilia terrae TaxID=1811224 RepID=A0ABT2CWJ1_9BURK|nr:hypothetical protein [Massilia terrae]MCS0658165.1 hypothetical protein [Massilia terrae]